MASAYHVLLAYLKNRATAYELNLRYEVKCKLVRLLHAHKWDDTVIRQVFLVIDWMMALPPELAVKLTTYMDTLKEGNKMEYVSSYERIKLEQQRREGMLEGKLEGELEGEQKGTAKMLTRLLTRRFGPLPPTVEAQIKAASNAQIESWFDSAVDAPTLDEVFQSLAH